jgi:hypothetical protein
MVTAKRKYGEQGNSRILLRSSILSAINNMPDNESDSHRISHVSSLTLQLIRYPQKKMHPTKQAGRIY